MEGPAMAETQQRAGSQSLVDPVTYELVRNTLLAISNEMALVVAKSAYSTAINEGLDFANATYDAHGKLLSQGEYDLPAFVGITIIAIPEVLRAIGRENMAEGDIYMINDPYVASTHCNDIHFVKPIFFEGEIVAFLSSTAHWSDVGGAVPGSLNLSAKTFYEEGVRIPAVTIFKRGELQQDLLNLILANVRQAWERVGDLHAQTAALKTGDQRMMALFRKHGKEKALATFAEMQNHAERMVRASLRKIPNGVYESTDLIDQDISTGEPVAIRLKLTIEDDHAIFDLTESDDAAGSGINGTIAATTSSIYNSTAALLPPMPMNSGIMRAIEIKARPGSICYAQPPVAISGTAATSLECTFAAVVKALSQAWPERGCGVSSTIHNTCYSGTDGREGFGAPFIEYVWSVGGMGGTEKNDGGNVVGSPYAASITNIPVELQERRYPLLWNRYMILQDSGGAGRSRGGLALNQLCSFPYQEGRLNSFGNRERFGPPGVFGGGDGQTAGLVLNMGTENEQRMSSFSTQETVNIGDTLTLWSNGGGGYGDPLERSVERVLEDVKDDYLSIAAARSQYGVVVVERDRRRLQFDVDEAATAELRRELATAR
jgi:N-methylhydantoinase B